jgi:hypothetical protein
MSPDLWAIPLSPVLPIELLTDLANGVAQGGDADPSYALKMLLAACGAAGERGSIDTMEVIGDLLHERLLRLDYPPQVMKSVLPYITGIYDSALKRAGGEQRQRLQIKFAGMLLIQFPRDHNDAEEQELGIARLYASMVLEATPPEDSRRRMDWMAETFPALERAAVMMAERDCFLAHLFIQWMGREVFTEWGLRTRVPEVMERIRALHEIHLHCARRCAELWTAMGDASRHLEMLELATYIQVLELRDGDGGRVTAREAIAAGDAMLLDLQLRGDTATVPGMGQRLFRLARFTGDPGAVEERLALQCAQTHSDADAHFARGAWEEAADAYSTLGYRYFAAADLTASEVLYQLAMYFFEKAEFTRSRLPRDETADPDPHVYRRLEANAFIFAAAARVSNTLATAELFEDAADQLSQAAGLVFQSMCLHTFYNSTAHFFLAQSELIFAARSRAFERCVDHVSRALTAFSQCFSGFRTIYDAYQTLLRAAIRREEEIDEHDVEATLARGGHPAPARPLEIVRECRNAPDADAFRGSLEALRLSLVYVNPMG